MQVNLDDGDLANPNENYYVLTGMLQGKFLLKEGKNYDIIHKNGSNTDTFMLSSINKEIKDTLNYLEKNPIPKMTKEEIRIQNERVLGK